MEKEKKKYEMPLACVVNVEAAELMAASGSESGDEKKVQGAMSDDSSLEWGGYLQRIWRSARLTVNDGTKKESDYEKTNQDEHPAARGVPVLHLTG